MTPTPRQIKEARKRAGLSQTAAAELIYSTLRTWQDWESPKVDSTMHPGLWELFLIKVEQLPSAPESTAPAASNDQQEAR